MISLTSFLVFRIKFSLSFFASILFIFTLFTNVENVGEPNKLLSVDLQQKENSHQHRTNLFKILYKPRPPLIVRRGETFRMKLYFQDPFDVETDQLRLEFLFGQYPQHSLGTLIFARVSQRPSANKDKFYGHITDIYRDRMSLLVNIPVTAAVSALKMRISVRREASKVIRSYDIISSIYILFNPWCQDDDVYMSNEKQRNEYVLNDVGRIYLGKWENAVGQTWIYGQHERQVLSAIFFLMEKTHLSIQSRADVIKVARSIAAIVNSYDDGGIMVGNWSTNFEHGTAPWHWSNSAKILEKYHSSNGEPIKFGQCWIYAGLTTAISRALGIPARTVTNFMSAHDTDHSLTVDKYFGFAGYPLDNINRDSVWDFHVWTDVWMKRADLGAKYDGWQVIDGTPQEVSDGKYQLGPAPVIAIHNGEINIPYDSAFVYAEVNADIVHWVRDFTSPLGWRRRYSDIQTIGHRLITKKVDVNDGLNDAEDITREYKKSEGSQNEREIMIKAAKLIGAEHLFRMK